MRPDTFNTVNAGRRGVEGSAGADVTDTSRTFSRPAALVDDTLAAREGHSSPYAHSATLPESVVCNELV
jgi:hypothetical protein